MKKTMINVICSLFVLATNVLISFFLSPFIVKNIGVEANGFVTLANNFVTYAQLIVSALNSMAARFIAIAYVKKDYKKANLYYNSVFWGNLIIVVVLIVPAIVALIKLEYLINVPANLLLDVKLLFGFIFFNFMITTGFPNWDCGTFVSNRLDRSYIPQFITSIIRCLFLFLTFSFFVSKVYYVGLAATIVTIILLICNGINTHKLTSELKISFYPNKIICSKKAIKELVMSGIWNSISNIGMILLTGVDLIICNVYIGATAMGILSLTKIIPNYMDQLASSLTSAFTPELTINYAKENKKKLIDGINQSIKLSSVIITVPIGIFIVLGKNFFSLWVPSQDASLLQILSILASFKFMFTGGIQILYNVFTVTNKVKENAVSQIITGICSIVLTLILVQFTDYGIYAVAGISSLCAVVKNLVFVIPACSKYLKVKSSVFYKQVIISLMSSLLIVAFGFCINSLFRIDSWMKLIINALVIASGGLIINVFLTLDKEERKYLLDKTLSKLGIKKYKYTLDGGNNDNFLDTTSIPLIKPDSISTSNSINEKAPILPKEDIILNKEIYTDRESLSNAIRNDNSYIKNIDFNYHYNFDIIDLILEEIKIYNYKFNNEDYLRDGKYPIILSNNHSFMKYVIDKDFNNIFYVDSFNMDKNEINGIINYTFKKVYFLKEKDKNITFNCDKFKDSNMMSNSYFIECLKYIK